MGKNKAIQIVQSYVDTYNNCRVTFKVKEDKGKLILDAGMWYIELGDDYQFCVSTHPNSGKEGLFSIEFDLVEKIWKGSQFFMFLYNKYKDMNDEDIKVEDHLWRK